LCRAPALLIIKAMFQQVAFKLSYLRPVSLG